MQLLVVFSIGKDETFGKIMTGLPAPLSTEGVIIWKVAFEILRDLLTNDDYQRKGISFAERVSATACLRSKDASLLPPILFSKPEHLGTSCLDCMVGSESKSNMFHADTIVASTFGLLPDRLQLQWQIKLWC